LLKNTFHKNERLCSKKAMEELFSRGRSLNRYPLKMMYIVTEYPLENQSQVMFVAPKKKFRRAHDRNLLKRRMREAYRLNKQQYYNELHLLNIKTQAAFIYIGTEQASFEEIRQSFVWLMQQSVNKLNQTKKEPN
jgi:ribonuclease P protein component